MHRPDTIAHLLLDLNAVALRLDPPFTWVSGIHSPIYCDNRIIVSHPQERQQIRDAFLSLIEEKNLEFAVVAGVATSGIPHAAWIADALNLPMIYVRSKQKAHGKTNIIEGTLQPGQRVLVVEDLVSTGGSVLAAINAVRNAGGVVTDCLAIFTYEFDRSVDAFKEAHTRLHTLSSFTHLLEAAIQRAYITAEQKQQILTWKINPNAWSHTQEISPPPMEQYQPRSTPRGHSSSMHPKSYGARAEHCTNPTAKKLLTLMEEKQTNLSVAADVTTKQKLIQIARDCGPEICLLKTHIDVVEDFDEALIEELRRLAAKHHFLIFEDRKFADIGNTVKKQYEKGIYHIADWADIINAHAVPGPGIIRGLKESGLPRGRGLLMLAEMSSNGNLATDSYTKKTLAMVNEHSDFVIGFIAMQKLIDDPRFIHMTPGVKLQTGTDALGQQYATPESVIYEQKSDIIIVGRGISQAEHMQKAASQYRKAGWEAYKKRLI